MTATTAAGETRRAPQPGSSTPVLGILGGMGPLASTAFLRTIYRLHLGEPEQGSPRCILDSDPTFPDRTAAIRDGRLDVLSARLERAVAGLLAAGAARVVIACVTVHRALPSLPEPLRRKVISLLDLVVDEVLAGGTGPFLLLATSGSRAARIFESHERWPLIAGRVLFPDEQDQERLHAWIYRLKAGESGETCLDWIATLRERRGAAGVIFGCTELHLLQDAIARVSGAAMGRIIDPLWIAARDLPRLLTGAG